EAPAARVGVRGLRGRGAAERCPGAALGERGGALPHRLAPDERERRDEAARDGGARAARPRVGGNRAARVSHRQRPRRRHRAPHGDVGTEAARDACAARSVRHGGRRAVAAARRVSRPPEPRARPALCARGVARLQRARRHRVRGSGRARGAAARGRGAAHRCAARRAAVPVLPAPAGRVLGHPARRRGDDRALRHHESGQHREAGGGLRARLPRAVRLRRPCPRGALLARPGTARLRWPHVAAELRRLPPARASAIYREALPLPRGARAHAPALVARPRHARAVPREQREPDVRQSARGRRAGQGAAQLRCGVVPAHVVTGYLGGEWNPVGGYFVVRQSDAHAWAEVWLEGRGWTRIDPTAAVAPERLRRGVLDLLPDALTTRERLLRSAEWLTRLLQQWDAANAWWSDHVVRFDY